MQRLRKHLGGWLVMLPGLLLFALFVWLPLLENVSLSFYRLHGYTKLNFAGLENYGAVLGDPLFVKAFFNTGLYVFWSLLIGFVLPIILALLLSEVVHLQGFFRISLYFPNIVPALATALLWKFMFDPEAGGVLNGLLAKLHLPAPQPWLNSPTWVIPLLVLTMTWKGAGATTLIYLGSLQNISTTYYEAARLEGATVWQRITQVTLPSLAPTIGLLLVLQIISVFQVFQEPLVMTGGGPNNASLSLLQLIYRYAFVRGDAAKAAALAVLVALSLMALTAIYWRISGRDERD